MKNRLVIIFMLAMAAVYVKAQNNENTFSMKLGSGKVYLLSEGQRNGSPNILIGARPEIVSKYAPNNTYPSATNVFLWQSNGKNILFDAGYGRALFDNLQSIQIKPEDIDAICITHLHGDHIGGLLRNEQAAFPKAKLYISKAEYDHWTNDQKINQLPENQRGGFSSAKRATEAYKDRLVLFEPNMNADSYDKELLQGLKAFATYGHTPGHTVYLLESGEERLLIWGDLTHAMAVQMPHPELGVTYDSDAEKAIQSRAIVLRMMAYYSIPVAGMHIAYPGMGTVERSEPGYKFVPFSGTSR